MNLFNTILLATEPELTNLIGKFINVLFEGIGNYGWTVVVFTIILKLILSPLDIWQKVATRKQSKAMARLQPQMEKIQRQYAKNPQMLQQKQAELYKKEKVTSSMLASCLPMIVTMIVFFVVFGGFNAMVSYHNEKIIYDVHSGYEQVITDAKADPVNAGKTDAEVRASITAEQRLAIYDKAIGKTESNPKGRYSFLWIDNIFMPDSWANVVPDYGTYVGSGMGKINVNSEILPNNDEYNVMFKPAMDAYNKKKAFDMGHWNGYMILPILSIVTSLLATKFMQGQTPQTGTAEQQKQAQMSQKIMLIMMPVMMGIFSLFYSSAFSLYIFISNLISTLFNLIYNIVAKKKDKQEAEKRLETTFIK